MLRFKESARHLARELRHSLGISPLVVIPGVDLHCRGMYIARGGVGRGRRQQGTKSTRVRRRRFMIMATQYTAVSHDVRENPTTNNSSGIRSAAAYGVLTL